MSEQPADRNQGMGSVDLRDTPPDVLLPPGYRLREKHRQAGARSPFGRRLLANTQEWGVGKRVSALLATVTALLALVVGGTNAWRALTDPSTKTNAILTTPKVEHGGVTMRDFLIDQYNIDIISATSNDEIRDALRQEGLPADVSDAQLQTVGIVLAFDWTIEGLEGRECRVEWSIHDAATRGVLPDRYLANRPAFPHPEIVPDTHNDEGNERIWVPRPPRAGPFFVRVELYDDRPVAERVRLRSADSERFP